MKTKPVQISEIATVGNQENLCFRLQASVCCTKLPKTFVGGVSSGKSRIKLHIVFAGRRTRTICRPGGDSFRPKRYFISIRSRSWNRHYRL
jgi:hypothetical protein